MGECADDRLKAGVFRSVCHEPGMNTLFNVASPTFKLRYMYMAGYTDEAEFDKFTQTLSLKGVGAKIKCPYLVLAGEDDQLSPIEYTYDLFETVSAPKQLLGPSWLTFHREFHRLDEELVAHLDGDVVRAWFNLRHLHLNLVIGLLDDNGLVVILVVGQIHRRDIGFP